MADRTAKQNKDQINKQETSNMERVQDVQQYKLQNRDR